MNKITQVFLLLTTLFFTACNSEFTPQISENIDKSYQDTPFTQEYHEAFEISTQASENDARSIEVDKSGSIWIASANGIFKKEKDSNIWTAIITGQNKGPSYDVKVDDHGTVWMGTWDGIYKYQNEKLTKANNIKAPISVLCNSKEGMYALGPKGIWLEENGKWKPIDYKIARSVRGALSDKKGGLWIATDAGLYHCSKSKSKLYQNNSELISCYLKDLDFDSRGILWLAGMGGVTVHNGTSKLQELTPKEGIPSINTNCIKRAPDGTMWIGTDIGIVRYYEDGKQSHRFSNRWLLDDVVRDISFDENGTAWIATAKGVSAIKNKEMTLASKENYFYNVLMERHIRDPWIAHVTALTTAGDLSTMKDTDDDNDGQYTAMYLAMEAMKYEVTGNKDAKVKARKALNFLMKLQTITETDGFFARTVVPIEWQHLNDNNRTYNNKELAEALVDEVRFKPVEKRWHESTDGKWLWKGDTSSDEMCGHMAAYYFYYEHVADEKEKVIVKNHVKKIIDHLIENDYNLVDIDGKHTYWGVWSPDKLNRDPDWAPERGINSLELLSYLKLVYHMTQDEKYQNLYLNLINKEGYLKNAKEIITSNPAWNTYIDPELLFLTFSPLFKYEEDPKLLNSYNELIDTWYQNFRKDESPFFNFMYTYLRETSYDLNKSVFFLQDTPLDLIDWPMDHSKREDIIPTRYPVLEVLQTDRLLPPSERATVRWDKNPWQLTGGNAHMEREPVFWLLPYWLGRYIGTIE